MKMSLEDLLNVEVSSVSKKMELLRKAGAAVFVISAEDIRRSGATSIPEALRMAPGVNVARINSSSWAITARGFNGRFANKLLVLMDGRSVYETSFSGVYWDVQDTMIEDIDRIEVIRGPGATLWGSNAVNGVINIITKHAVDTQGGLIVLGGGNVEQATGGLRYGATIGENTAGKVFVKYKKNKDYIDTNSGSNAGDSWDSLRGGFRIDSDLSNDDKLTVQGDTYHNNENQIVRLWTLNAPYTTSNADAFTSSGWNTLARWEHVLGDESSFSLQMYVDHTKRDEIYAGQTHDTVDIDFQHNFGLGDWQHVVWGLGYRNVKETIRNSYSTGIYNVKPDSKLMSAFVQDDLKLGTDDLHLVLGSKFERNDFTGWEVQPNVRLTWTPDDSQTIWASVSKAVRTPSRYEEYAQVVGSVIPPMPPFLPVAVPVMVYGNTDVQSEKLFAYELGYRLQVSESVSFDVASFYNVYDRLRTFEPVPSQFLVLMNNKASGKTYGFELAANWQAKDWWQLHLAYSNLNVKLKSSILNTNDQWLASWQGGTPKHQVVLRSNMSLGSNLELDVMGRYMSQLTNVSPSAVIPTLNDVDAYTDLDVRIGWKPSDNLELSMAGKNLLHANHLEFIQESFIRPTSVERSFYADVTLKF